MPKTRVVGYDGFVGVLGGGGSGIFDQTVDNGTHNALIGYWEASFPRVATAVTGFADTLVHNRLGIMSIEGMLRGSPLYDAATTSPGIKDRAAGGSTLVLTVVTGCSYTLTAVLPDERFRVDKGGSSDFEAAFVNGDSDTLTETWDESG